MKNRGSVIWIFLSVYILGISADDHGENSMSYDKDSFEKAVTEKRLFVMFFAPWCGHCKRLAPTWDELAKLYNIEGSQVTIGKVDCTVERALCADNGVKGYPTVKFFYKKKDDALKYSSARTIEALKTFVEEQLAKETEEKVVIDEDEEAVKQEDNKPYDLTKDTFSKHVQTGHHFVKFYAPWCGHCKKLAPTWEELAGKVDRNKATIAKVDCTQYSEICKQFSVRGYPTLLWLTDGEKVDQYQGSRTLEDLTAFVAKMAAREPSGDKLGTDGKVPEPEEEKKVEEEKQKPTPVVSYTKDNFVEMISKGNSFVKFFTPWCGHCKNLAPVWIQLAEEYQSNEKLKIAEVDCTKFDSVCNENEVRGYPTLIWFKNGQKVEAYKKERSLEKLKAFTETMLGDDKAPPQDDVEDFKQRISKGYHFVEFHTPWCDHCKRLAPAWDKLTKDLKKEGKVTASKVDCDQYSATVCDANGITGYPTMVWFKDGERIDSKSGVMDLDGLHAYVKKMIAMDESIVTILTSDTFKKAVAKDHFFVEFYTPWCEHCETMAPRLEELAQGLRNDKTVTVAKVDCQSSGKQLCDELEIENYPTHMWFKDGERLDRVSGQMTLEGLKSYVNKMKSLDDSNMKDMTGDQFSKKISKGSFFIEFYTPWCEHCKTLAPTLEELATSYKGNDKVTVAKMDCTLYEKLCDSYGIEHYPVMVWFEDGEKVDSFSGVKTLEYLKDYVNKMLSQGGNPLFDLTAAMFPGHVAKGNHFVKFFAPWCGHCKRMAPVWQDLADKLKGNSEVTIAKVDCTVHGTICDNFGIRGYPTLKFFKDGEAIDEYAGSRSLDALSEYVSKMIVSPETEPVEFDPVMPLGPEDFEETVAEKFTFVAFMIPDDSKWKTLEPVWNDLAKSMDESGDTVIASVDCKAHKDLCKQQEIEEYPMMKLYQNGEDVAIYRGDWSLGAFTEFLEFLTEELGKTEHEHEEL